MESENEIETHNCGHCKFHLPNKATGYGCTQPPKITSGKGKGTRAYWLCRCKECSYNGKGRVAEDGENCKCFSDRYINDKVFYEWLANCNDGALNSSGYWKRCIIKGTRYEVYRFRLGKEYKYFYGTTRNEAKEKYDEFVKEWKSKNG